MNLSEKAVGYRKLILYGASCLISVSSGQRINNILQALLCIYWQVPTTFK